MRSDDIRDLRLERLQRQSLAPLAPDLSISASELLAALIGKKAHGALLCGYSHQRVIGQRGHGRGSRLTDIATQQDQPMVRILQEFPGNAALEFILDCARRGAVGQAGAIGDAVHVRVDRDRGLAETGVEHDVGRLAADAGQLFERLAVLRHTAAVAFHQQTAGGHDIARLGVVKPDGADMALKAGQPELEHGGRRRRAAKQRWRREIDALVGRLRGQDYGDQQFKRRAELQLALGMRVGRSQMDEDLTALSPGSSRRRAGRQRGLQRCALALREQPRALAPVTFGTRTMAFKARAIGRSARRGLISPGAVACTMQSTGQAARHSSQPLHSPSSTV